jgi:recombination associated protein RdgC
MFFKNASFYKLGENRKFTVDELRTALEQNTFVECLATQTFNSGFVSPIEGDDRLVIQIKPNVFAICLKRQEKIIPSSSVKESVDKKIKELQQDNVPIDKKLKSEIKDNVSVELATRALSKIEKTVSYFDLENGWLVVDTAAAKKAEHLLSKLWLALKCKEGEIFTATPLCKALVAGFNQLEFEINHPEFESNFKNHFSIDTKFIAKNEDGKKISYSDAELSSSKLREYISSGMNLIELGFKFKENIAFVLDKKFIIKRLNFLEGSKEDYSLTYDNKTDQFLVQMFLTVSELGELLNALVDGFGGLKNG